MWFHESLYSKSLGVNGVKVKVEEKVSKRVKKKFVKPSLGNTLGNNWFRRKWRGESGLSNISQDLNVEQRYKM